MCVASLQAQSRPVFALLQQQRPSQRQGATRSPRHSQARAAAGGGVVGWRLLHIDGLRRRRSVGSVVGVARGRWWVALQALQAARRACRGAEGTQQAHLEQGQCHGAAAPPSSNAHMAWRGRRRIGARGIGARRRPIVTWQGPAGGGRNVWRSMRRSAGGPAAGAACAGSRPAKGVTPAWRWIVDALGVTSWKQGADRAGGGAEVGAGMRCERERRRQAGEAAGEAAATAAGMDTDGRVAS